MKFDAGLYNRPMTHLTRTTAKDAYGGTSYTFATDGNTYFGSVEQTESQEVDELGRVVTITRAKIRLRGWFISITPLDRLTDLQFNETYIVDSVARGDDEWCLTAHKF